MKPAGYTPGWSWIGPQRVGGRYFCGYWREEFTVLSFQGSGNATGMMTVRWAKGNTTTHCTPWDPQRDRVVSQPPTAGIPSWIVMKTDADVSTAIDAADTLGRLLSNLNTRTGSPQGYALLDEMLTHTSDQIDIIRKQLNY